MKESTIKLIMVAVVCAITLFTLARESRGAEVDCVTWLKGNVASEDVLGMGVEGPVLVVQLKDSTSLLLIPVKGVELTEEGRKTLKSIGQCIQDGELFHIWKTPPSKSIEAELDSEGKIPNERL